MKNFIKLTMIAFVAAISLTSCHFVTPDADEEAVLIDKPLFFGHGGVREKAVKTGLTWCWWTTHSSYYKIIPIRYDVVFDDIMSNNNTPLDYATYVTLQIQKSKSPVLHTNYGPDWFINNVEAVYRNFVRDEVSKYEAFDLMSNREVSAMIDVNIEKKMNEYFASLNSTSEFPVTCKGVITGRAKPNQKTLDEMDNTAAAIQAKETQDRSAEMETARANAERQRAIADKAYMREMGLTPDQFITLKIVEKSNPNIDIVMGGGTNSMWNIRR